MKLFLARLLSQIFLLPYRFNSRITIGKGVITNHKLRIKGPGKVVLHDGVNLWAHAEKTQFLTFTKEARIEIGKNSRLNGCIVQARESVKVGEDCLIGSAIIMDNDFHNSELKYRFDTTQIPTRPVQIGNRVWVAGQAVVLKGVNIGNNSVVAIRSVVCKSVEANTVVGGNPAQKLKDLPVEV